MARLIDADELRELYNERNNFDTYNDYSFVVDTLDYMPTIDAETVRHGNWRHYERMLTCSECGTVFYDDIMEYFGEEVPKYCPECGARMDL